MPAGARQNFGQNNWPPVCGDWRQEGHHYLARPKGDMNTKGSAERDKANQNFSDIPYHGAKTKRDYKISDLDVLNLALNHQHGYHACSHTGLWRSG